MGAWVADNVNAMWGLTFASILILSLLPAEAQESESGSSWIWNLGHVPAYAVLAGVTALALSRRGPLGPYTRLRAGAAIVLLATGLELLQPLVGRTASLADTANGALGVLIGLSVQAFLAGKMQSQTAKRGGESGLR